MCLSKGPEKNRDTKYKGVFGIFFFLFVFVCLLLPYCCISTWGAVRKTTGIELLLDYIEQAYKINTNKIPFNKNEKKISKNVFYKKKQNKTKITYRMGLLCTKVVMFSKFCFQQILIQGTGTLRGPFKDNITISGCVCACRRKCMLMCIVKHSVALLYVLCMA